MAGTAEDAHAVRAAYRATRAILNARDLGDLQAAILTLCADLGATVVAPTSEGSPTLPIDVMIGDGEPLLPASDDPQVRERITIYLVPAINDALRIARQLRGARRLVEDATHDPLTGLWNRRSIELALNRAKHGDCVALIDLDRFKGVNDSFGHSAGDLLLVRFASFLAASLRDVDIVGRIGGEEFVAIFPEVDVTTAVAVLEKLRISWLDEAPMPVTFSAGVAAVPAGEDMSGIPGRDALLEADTLMYLGKANGRDRIEGAPTTPDVDN